MSDTPELVAQFGLKEDVAKNLQWSHDAKCLKSGQLEGMEIKADLSQSALVISLPQAYLEYTYPDWDPPSRWDDGISGIVADYSINAQTRHEENGGDDSNEISGNGTVGVNLGPWRMRADWQTNYQHTRSNDDDEEFSGDDTQKNGSGVAIMLAGVTVIKAKLALGEDYLNLTFSTVLIMLVAVSALTIKCCLPTCAATRQTFPAWHTPQQK